MYNYIKKNTIVWCLYTVISIFGLFSVVRADSKICGNKTMVVTISNDVIKQAKAFVEKLQKNIDLGSAQGKLLGIFKQFIMTIASDVGEIGVLLDEKKSLIKLVAAVAYGIALFAKELVQRYGNDENQKKSLEQYIDTLLQDFLTKSGVSCAACPATRAKELIGHIRPELDAVFNIQPTECAHEIVSIVAAAQQERDCLERCLKQGIAKYLQNSDVDGVIRVIKSSIFTKIKQKNDILINQLKRHYNGDVSWIEPFGNRLKEAAFCARSVKHYCGW